MAYVKTNWVDRVEGPKKYRITDNGDGTVSIENVSEVIHEGTPLNAANLNHIEEGIVDAENSTGGIGEVLAVLETIVEVEDETDNI